MISVEIPKLWQAPALRVGPQRLVSISETPGANVRRDPQGSQSGRTFLFVCLFLKRQPLTQDPTRDPISSSGLYTEKALKCYEEDYFVHQQIIALLDCIV